MIASCSALPMQLLLVSCNPHLSDQLHLGIGETGYVCKDADYVPKGVLTCPQRGLSAAWQGEGCAQKPGKLQRRPLPAVNEGPAQSRQKDYRQLSGRRQLANDRASNGHRTSIAAAAGKGDRSCMSRLQITRS